VTDRNYKAPVALNTSGFGVSFYSAGGGGDKATANAIFEDYLAGKLSEALLSISRHSVSADQAGSSGREIEKLSLHRPAATLSAKVIDVLSDLFIRRGVPVHTDPAAVADAARLSKRSATAVGWLPQDNENRYPA
jgi:hypothetical protein